MRSEIDAYFALFHGEEIRLGAMEKSAQKYLAAVDALMKQGEIIGQRYFSEKMREDMMLIMPSKIAKIEEPPTPIERWYT